MKYVYLLLNFFAYSLGGRLFLIFLVSSFVTVILLNTLGWGLIRNEIDRQIFPHFRYYISYIRREIGVPPDYEGARDLARRTDTVIRIVSPRGVVWSSNEEETGDEEEEMDEEREEEGGSYFPSFGEGNLVAKRKHHKIYRGEFGTVIESRIAGYGYIFYVWDEHTEKRLPWIFLFLGLGLFILIALVYFLVRVQISPLKEIREGIMRVGEGDLDEPVRRIGKGELGDLGVGINRMSQRISEMLKGKRMLLLAMSHELKTPLTSMRLNVELLPTSLEKERLIVNIESMQNLIQDLLTSEALQETGEDSARIDVVSEVGLFLEKEFAGQVDFEKYESSLEVGIDAQNVELLIRNLVKNALRHTPEGGENPLVRIRVEGNDCIIEVVDGGEGVLESELSSLGEAFYRHDSSRTRMTGGTGLGLYLCRLIVEGRGGTIIFKNGVEGRTGLFVQVRLPVYVRK